MLKKILSMLLVILLVNLAVMPSIYANDSKTEKEAKFAEKVKSNIVKLGVGIDSKVEVKLKDGTKLKGYVSEINDNGFAITDNIGKTTAVPYPQVKQAKGFNGKGWIVVGVFIAVLLGIIIWAASHDN